MGKQISLVLADELFRQAQLFAGRSGRDVTEVLTEAIESSFDPLGLLAVEAGQASEWSDAEVLAAAGAMMDPEDDRRLSELLKGQRENTLNHEERDTLRHLMEVYQAGLLGKSEGMAEAVRRGLLPTPSP